jgi:predicted CXXCH cytochrome family protein
MNTLVRKHWRHARLFAAMLLVAGSYHAVAQQGQIGVRPLTPQEIKNHALPATTQTSGGLLSVGLGQPAYLEAQVRTTVAASNILGVTWELTAKPIGSSAALVESPLPLSVPMFNYSERSAYQLAARSVLRPDVAGQYLVTATVNTNGGNLVLTRTITAATYLGNQICQLCHSGGYLPDMMTPWSQTHHATAFSNALDGVSTDHFTQNCIKCHVVGYDVNTNAVNAGFDDVQLSTGWTMPTVLTNGNFAAMPQALREKSNIQCESCHGPGSEHASAFGDPSRIAKSHGVGDCAQCHDSLTHHPKAQEWNNSGHAVMGSHTSASCSRCHTSQGFANFVAGEPAVSTPYEVVGCTTCHDPHGSTNPHQLRTGPSVTLMDNKTVVTGGGNGQICMNCHITRRDATNYVETTAGSSGFGPHYGAQTDMLVGANAITYGKEIPSSAHFEVTEDTCVTCHMQDQASGLPGFTHTGGHTFTLSWDGGTTNTVADDIHLTASCTQCHGSIADFDLKRQDYDGDGTVEGVQTEVKGLMDELGRLLPPLGSPTVTISSAYTKPQLRAAYNYRFVQYDGSYGVHNVAYAVGLLKASIADLTDDADRDGVSDKWEIAQFGSITLYDGEDDTDGDGVKNSLEAAAGTNPMLVDSDGDGINDYAELQAGSDPLNAADQPGFVVQIYTAAEIEFASQVGLKYQVQKVSDLTGAWMNVGSVTNGTGNNISMVTSTRTGPSQGYFRVVQVP